jgi:hypothetical protein
MDAATDITPDDVNVPATPADVTAPISDDLSGGSDIDRLLAEFDRATAQPATDNNAAPDATTPPQDDIDSFLQSLDTSSADRQRIDALTGQIDGLKAAEFQRAERADFDKFSSKLQAELGPNVPDDYARTLLLSMSAENPALESAWRYRNLTAEQRRAADAEFRQLEALYAQAQREPDDPRKQQVLMQMEQRGQELGLMMNARTMLNNAWRDVVKRAGKVAPPVDELATGDHNAVAALVRGASAPVDLAEPPPNFGSMSESEFQEWTRKNVR